MTLANSKQADQGRNMCKCDVNNHWPVEVACFVMTRHSLHRLGNSKHDRYFELYISFRAVIWCTTSVLRTYNRNLAWTLCTPPAQRWETMVSDCTIWKTHCWVRLGRTDVQTQMCWLGFYLKEQSLIAKDTIYPINRADRSIKLKSAQLADVRKLNYVVSQIRRLATS